MQALKIRNLCKKFFRAEQPAVENLALEVAAGELFTVVGESGCGKTTLLRLIAGFEIPERGEIVINDRIAVGPRTFLPPEKRGVGMVFQDYALFPHLDVYQNICFGLTRKSPAEKRARVQQLIELVELVGLEKRYPHELSGGQQQRVALARALAPNPSVLLLDEPFSNLDESLRAQVRDDIRSILRRTRTTAVLVTHDTKDALTVSDRIALMKEGRILQVDIPENMYLRPCNRYAANFFGKTNIFKVTASNGSFETPMGLIPTPSHLKNCGEAHLAIRPEDFAIVEGCQGSICTRVKGISFHGKHKELSLSAIHSDEEFVVHVATQEPVQVNDRIHVKPQEGKIHLMR